MKTKSFSKGKPQECIESESESGYLSSSSEQHYSSTLNSNHPSIQSQPVGQNRSSHKHKITSKHPLFSFKKNIDENLCIPAQNCRKKQQSDQKYQDEQGSNSTKQGQRLAQHAYNHISKQNLAEEVQIPEFNEEIKIIADKRGSNKCHFFNVSETKSLRKTHGQESQICNQAPQYLPGKNASKSCIHIQLNNFIVETKFKMAGLLCRLQKVEHRRSQLNGQIQVISKDNQQISQRIVRLLEEQGQLSRAKARWKSSKSQLQCLYKEVSLKIERQQQIEKQNMGIQECQLYFRQKSKQKHDALLGHSQEKAKGSLAQRLRIKVQKS